MLKEKNTVNHILKFEQNQTETSY